MEGKGGHSRAITKEGSRDLLKRKKLQHTDDKDGERKRSTFSNRSEIGYWTSEQNGSDDKSMPKSRLTGRRMRTGEMCPGRAIKGHERTPSATALPQSKGRTGGKAGD